MTDTLIEFHKQHTAWARTQLGKDSVEAQHGYAVALDDMYDTGYDYAAEILADLELVEAPSDYIDGYRRGTRNATFGNPAHVWTQTSCPAYRSMRGADCTCGGAK